MNDKSPHSSVYGPVPSWRVGDSLGIDLICGPSTCSFNCIYCQLGNIQNITLQRQTYISTQKVLDDFHKSNWEDADIITYSGSGEPTLAENLGEVIREIGVLTSTPQLVLTNGTLLHHSQVIIDLSLVERVYVKLDAATEEGFQRVNRPAPGIHFDHLVDKIQRFRQEYLGYLGIQIMFLPSSLKEVDEFCQVLEKIQPDEIQLNTPTRPYPKTWHISSRGGHSAELRQYDAIPLRTLTPEQALEVEETIRARTGIRVISFNNDTAK